MTEKYIDLAERIKRDRDMGPLTGLDRVTYTLRRLDEHPGHFHTNKKEMHNV